jgi:four helix bundle protein
MNQGEKIKSFTDLIAWQKGHKLVLLIYKITCDFPKHEMYSLGDQMRRCAISITSNITEGFSRKSYKEKTQFYSISLGSITELQNQLLVTRDVGYISKDDFTNLANQTVEVNKLLNGLIKGSKSRLENLDS